jgi:hypothetical protein
MEEVPLRVEHEVAKMWVVVKGEVKGDYLRWMEQVIEVVHQGRVKVMSQKT